MYYQFFDKFLFKKMILILIFNVSFLIFVSIYLNKIKKIILNICFSVTY